MHGIATDSIIIEKTHIQTRPFTPFFKKLEKLEKIKDVSPFPGPDEGWELEAEDYPLFYGVDYMAAENPHQEIVSDLHGMKSCQRPRDQCRFVSKGFKDTWLLSNKSSN
ncbi:MAG: hypothetical protein B6242_05835 [Anaerolineaceae bacterium 4572_78]|nr:MAG: hypothetical protein B6242_05835 [Anaerolineaceae bacterium 4572_78]